MKLVGVILILLIVTLTTPIRVVTATPRIIDSLVSDTTFTVFGQEIVPLGDQNGDGYADLLAWDYRPAAYLYYGGNPPSGQMALRFCADGRISNIGDVNGDGYYDFASSCGSRFRIYYGGPNIDTIPDRVFGLDTLVPWGFTIHGHDIDSDGTDDIITWNNLQKSCLLFELQNPNDSVPAKVIWPSDFTLPGYAFGDGMIGGNFNGDNRVDFAANFRPDPSYNLKAEIRLFFGGAGFGNSPSKVIKCPEPLRADSWAFAYKMANLGDVNGDGYDDIIASFDNSSRHPNHYVFFGGPNFDTIPDLIIDDRTQWGTGIGDVNGDGYADFATSLALESSSTSYINIYYGGPNLDTTVDLHLNVTDVAGYHIVFGRDVAGLGDVDGDGVDDFAVSAVNADNRGVVFIFAGEKSPSDVGSGDGDPLPSGFSLHPAYPNPFNPSTTISFDLPKRETVKLTVYDITGRIVRTLLNRPLVAGTFKVQWDGTSESGKPVASGVYIITLSTPDYKNTNKGTLIK